ncbi:MAG: hypothetical protein RIQ95_620, partial [Pseudomonadota bacterium]
MNQEQDTSTSTDSRPCEQRASLPIDRRYILRCLPISLLGSTSLIAPLQMAHAQAFPAKPIRFVVPFPAGGGVDLVARTIGEKLS